MPKQKNTSQSKQQSPGQVNQAIVRLLAAVDNAIVAAEEARSARRELASLIASGKEAASS